MGGGGGGGGGGDGGEGGGEGEAAAAEGGGAAPAACCALVADCKVSRGRCVVADAWEPLLAAAQGAAGYEAALFRWSESELGLPVWLPVGCPPLLPPSRHTIGALHRHLPRCASRPKLHPLLHDPLAPHPNTFTPNTLPQPQVHPLLYDQFSQGALRAADSYSSAAQREAVMPLATGNADALRRLTQVPGAGPSHALSETFPRPFRGGSWLAQGACGGAHARGRGEAVRGGADGVARRRSRWSAAPRRRHTDPRRRHADPRRSHTAPGLPSAARADTHSAAALQF